MNNPIFLKVILVSDSPMLVPVDGQMRMGAKGMLTQIDPKMQVTPREVLTLEEGMIFGTDDLVSHAKGWYVSGVTIYQITDESGIYMDALSTDHLVFISAYKKFTSNVLATGDPLNSNGRVKAVKLSFMESLKKDMDLSPPTIEKDGWYVDTELWWHLIRNYSKKKNTLLIGDSGAGKTDLVQILMKKIGKPLNIFDMAISNPTKSLCGNLRADNGTTHYQYARFAQVIQQEGAVLLDELSRANPTANNILLPVTDKRRTLYIEDAITDQEIKLHDKCAIWATANIGTKFIGTSQLDHALLNRFGQVPVEYPPAEKESLLLQKVFKLNKNTADGLVGIATTIREHTDLSKDVSTRQLFELAELIGDGYSVSEAFRWAVLQQFDSDKGDGGERQTVLSILQSS